MKHPMPSLRRSERGLTLIEVMIVVVILGIIATITVVQLSDEPDRARVAKAKTDMRSIETALELYRLDNYSYPAGDQGLHALVAPRSGGLSSSGYMKKVPLDPWNNEYVYQFPGDHGPFDLYSLGRDGSEGGEGVDAEIGNWQDN